MSEHNPYASPTSNLEPTPDGKAVKVSAQTLENLRRTKPWVRFISVCSFLAIGLTFLIGMIGGISRISAEVGKGGIGNPEVLSESIGKGIVFLLFGCIPLYPTMKIFSYASRIEDLLISGSSADLEAALGEQMRFWRIMGILLMVYVGLMALFFAIGIIGAVSR